MAKKSPNTAIMAESGGEAALEELNYCIPVLEENSARSRKNEEITPTFCFLGPQGGHNGHAWPWTTGCK